MKRSLLIGCGNSRIKKVVVNGDHEWAGKLTTIDMDPNCGADIVWNLDDHPLPFPDETFDEMGAYDVLEHLGKQGDWRGWFDEMTEYWRIMKPGGTFGIINPIGEDRFADPGHTRFISSNHFGFLNKTFYENSFKQKLPVTDYRFYWKKNFEIPYCEKMEGDHHFVIVLRKT